MLSEAIKYQEKAFSLLWDALIDDAKWFQFYEPTYQIDVRITQSQEYGVERLVEEGYGHIVEDLKLQAKQNYLTLKKALAEK